MIKYLHSLQLVIIISFGLTFLGCGNISDRSSMGSYAIEKLTYQSNHTPIIINEVLSANANTNYDPDFKEFSDWIELYNDSNETIDISGYYLSDKEDNPTKWQIPADTSIEAHSYLLIWADGEDTKQKALHSNFKLSQEGESVTLYDRDETLIDSIEYEAQESDISCSKSDTQIIYMTPSPNAKNNPVHQLLLRSSKPSFLLKSGFYAGGQLVELEAKGDIYYTLDGSHPTPASQLYNAPIMIDKTTVIRAISIEEGKFPSHSYSQTYLIDEEITLPVMSLSIDDAYLYGDDIGIYNNFSKEWMKNGKMELIKDYIRAGNVELIKDGKSMFSKNVGIKLHGGFSRSFPQKSFSIFFKNRYGEKSLNYPLFVDKPQIEKVKSFMLRNSGSDWKYTMMRDALTHSIAKEIGDIDYLSYEPVIIFINGEYYGLLNLREQANKDYVRLNHSVDPYKIDLIKEKVVSIVLDGDDISYKKILDFSKNNSMVDDKNYAYIKNMVDTENLMNYITLQSYIGNSDALYNNTKLWKKRDIHSQWRWILYDTDFGFSLKDFIDITNVNFNTFQFLILDESAVMHHSATSTIFRSLLENDSFKESFLSRYKNLLNTVFTPENINHKITTIKNKIAPEMPRHLKKWFGAERTFEDWENDVEELYNYSNARNDIVREQLENLF
jgi:hypothetical protein